MLITSYYRKILL